MERKSGGRKPGQIKPEKAERKLTDTVLLQMMEEEYLEGIYGMEELQIGPEAGVVVLLPLHHLPDTAQVTMLDRLLTAMGFQAADRRYAYHSGRPEGQIVWEKNAKILFFTKDPATEPALMQDESSGQKWYYLPPAASINEDKEIKRRVWSLLKN